MRVRKPSAERAARSHTATISSPARASRRPMAARSRVAPINHRRRRRRPCRRARARSRETPARSRSGIARCREPANVGPMRRSHSRVARRVDSQAITTPEEMFTSYTYTASSAFADSRRRRSSITTLAPTTPVSRRRSRCRTHVYETVSLSHATTIRSSRFFQ